MESKDKAFRKGMRVREWDSSDSGRIIELDTSSPYMKVRWDGIEQPTWTIAGYLRPEKFHEFLFRRHGHGKWSWPEAIFRYAIIAFGYVVSFITFKDYGWIVVIFLTALIGLILRLHWKNFNGKTA